MQSHGWKAVASRRDGVIGHAELVSCGVAPATIQGWVRRGRLVRLHRGVYALERPPETMRGRAIAALLAVGPGAVLSHQTAAAFWRIAAEPHEIHLSMPNAVRSREGITVHPNARLDPRDVRRKTGLPLTSPSRTLLDLAATLEADGLRTAAPKPGTSTSPAKPNWSGRSDD